MDVGSLGKTNKQLIDVLTLDANSYTKEKDKSQMFYIMSANRNELKVV